MSRKFKKHKQERKENQFSPLIHDNNVLRTCFIYLLQFREASDAMQEWWLVPSAELIVIRESFFWRANRDFISHPSALVVTSTFVLCHICLLNLTDQATKHWHPFDRDSVKNFNCLQCFTSHDRQCGRHVRHCLPPSKPHCRSLARALVRRSIGRNRRVT